MNRKEFMKACGGSCLAMFGIAALTQSCKSTHYVQGSGTNDKLQVSQSDFVSAKNGELSFRKFIIVKSDQLDYPLVVYRNPENTYTALLLRCTHQGVELNVAGAIITCSAHGSEFGKTGEVITGPAEQKLRSFPVVKDEKNIYINLV